MFAPCLWCGSKLISFYLLAASKNIGQHSEAVGGVAGGELEAAPGHDGHEAGAGGNQAAARECFSGARNLL